MKLRNSQAGFSVFELLLVVLVLAALAVVTFKVMTDHSKAYQNSTNVASQPVNTAGDVSSAPQINKPADLSKAEDILDQNDPAIANQGDSNQLNSQFAALN